MIAPLLWTNEMVPFLKIVLIGWIEAQRHKARGLQIPISDVKLMLETHYDDGSLEPIELKTFRQTFQSG